MTSTHTASDLATEIPNLFASPPERLSFAPTLEVRAFLLRREQGNLLIYSAPTLGVELGAINELGGVSRWYLNHWHESGFIPDELDTPLFVHAADRQHVEKKRPVHETFTERHALDQDFEVIPTPGHTEGATAYVWESGEHRMLFTGDTLYLDRGEWTAGLLESSDRVRFVESLELIRELDFDLLVPWATSVGDAFYATTDSADAKRRIDAILERLRA
jgi:glyoxylase-like metal-dependent hydrolase (beta-lactamase superfamily II)